MAEPQDNSASLPNGRSIAWGALTNWLVFVATLVVAFFLAPYLLRRLGEARYGVWCMVEALLAYFTLLDLGIAACLVRYVARCRALSDHQELNRYAAAAFWLYSAAGGLVLMVSLPLALGLAPFLEKRLDQTDHVMPFLLVMLTQFAITLPLSVFPTLLDGLQRFGRKSAVRLIALALRVSGMVVVMETTPGLTGLAVVLSVSQIIEHGAMWWVVRRDLPGLSLSWRLVDRATLREVRGYSRDAFLAMVAGRLSGQSGPIVSGLFLSAAAAAHYTLAYRLIDMGKNLLRAATTTLTPAISQREAVNDNEGLRRLFLEASRAVLYVALPIHGGLWFFGHAFLHRWLGSSSIADASYPVAVILSLTLTLGVAQSVAARVLYGLGQLRGFARLALLEGGVVVVLGMVATPLWHLTGLALAVAVPNVLFCLWTITAACRHTQTSGMEYWRRSCWRPLTTVVIPATIWWAAGPVSATWCDLFTTAALGLIPYALVVLMCERNLRPFHISQQLGQAMLGNISALFRNRS
jgi:O-antigen/teichoic acid export membrane protein